MPFKVHGRITIGYDFGIFHRYSIYGLQFVEMIAFNKLRLDFITAFDIHVTKNRTKTCVVYESIYTPFYPSIYITNTH